MFDTIYHIITGAGTARRAPEILSRLSRLGPRVIAIPTPNAARIVSGREMVLAFGDDARHRVVESYFDDAILPRPPHGVVLVAPCTFDSLNKLALGIADNLALSVTAEAIGRRTPVVVALSVNQPLWQHPRTADSIATLRSWGVDLIQPAGLPDAPTLDSTDTLIAAVEHATRTTRHPPGVRLC